jgi:hypothetical protein
MDINGLTRVSPGSEMYRNVMKTERVNKIRWWMVEGTKKDKKVTIKTGVNKMIPDIS